MHEWKLLAYLKFFYSVVPLKLSFESIYNLNNIKEVSVTDSFVTLDEKTRGCSNDFTFDECTTKLYVDAVNGTCNCLPMKMRVSNEVSRKCKRN